MSFSLDERRHSAAHVMAAAIQRLYPGAKFGVGPVVEHGFYYDVETPTPITAADLSRIQETMQRIQKENPAFVREEMNIEQAIALFEQLGQPYKVELLRDLRDRGTTAMKDVGDAVVDSVEAVSVYKTGEFVDLCRGPHVSEAKEIGVVKLTKLAGAYWRGKETNPQLQRIYGWCFVTKEDLVAHQHMIEEAEKRDHRKIGKELGLFLFSDLVGPGLPLWTPKGTALREALNDFVWSLRKPYGYQRVTIPHITKRDLYETSGHWAKYADDLFKIQTRDGHEFAMKPMNCPHHAQIYHHEQRSYRDLPIRYAETTMVYRDEQSGELGGLSRVLSITQDDAHVFCRTSQIAQEVESIWQIITRFYGAFGFVLTPRLSRRDPDNLQKYQGALEDWVLAESSLRDVLEQKGSSWIDGPGEAAFYGPKIDFMAKDSLGRTHQVATIQLDFTQPKNFGLTCVNEQSEKETIVMIHCAIMGSIERFMAVMIEHTAGVFPLWLAPVQVGIASVADRYADTAHEIGAWLREAGFRVEVDDSSESVGKKIRQAERMKLPVSIVVGEKEAAGEPFTLRIRGEVDQVSVPREELLAFLQARVQARQ
ncbi:threonine--tRNA ligase [Patescibacteria group bacterium]|nr:threonine--tRNA ligase [Patescibacteria group bacterium]MDQ5919404.1 threonyl-tRNA synthetase [Patescibacteria group bacterium]